MNISQLNPSSLDDQKPLSSYRITVAVTELGYGGAKKYTIVLANMLLELGAEVNLLVFSQGEDQFSEVTKCPVEVIDTSQNNSRVLRLFRRYRAYRKAKNDAHFFISSLTGPNLLNALTRGPASTVIIEHGSRIYDPNITPRIRLLHRFFFDPIKFYFAQKIVSVSWGLSNEIKKLAWKDVSQKLVILHPPLDLGTKDSKPNRLKEDFTKQKLQSSRYICFVGRLSLEKGLLDAIRIYKDVSKTIPSVKLVIVGDGPLWDQAIALVHSLQIALNDFHEGIPSVIFWGATDDPNVHMRGSEGLLVPSEVEAFGYVILEGIAAGVPVFAADVPWGVREALTLGVEWRKDALAREVIQVTEFGFLLPRPNTARFREMWASVIIKSLNEKSLKCEDSDLAYTRKARLSEYSVSHAKQKWTSLLLQQKRSS